MNKKQKKIAKELLANINRQSTVENTHGAVRCYCEFMAECRKQVDLKELETKFVAKGVALMAHNNVASAAMATIGMGTSMGVNDSFSFSGR